MFASSLGVIDWALVQASNRANTNTVINCADGHFLSTIVHASLDHPPPNQAQNPQAVAAARAELARLDPVLRQHCP